MSLQTIFQALPSRVHILKPIINHQLKLLEITEVGALMLHHSIRNVVTATGALGVRRLLRNIATVGLDKVQLPPPPPHTHTRTPKHSKKSNKKMRGGLGQRAETHGGLLIRDTSLPFILRCEPQRSCRNLQQADDIMHVAALAPRQLGVVFVVVCSQRFTYQYKRRFL